jgi:hypothetical protein
MDFTARAYGGRGWRAMREPHGGVLAGQACGMWMSAFSILEGRRQSMRMSLAGGQERPYRPVRQQPANSGRSSGALNFLHSGHWDDPSKGPREL